MKTFLNRTLGWLLKVAAVLASGTVHAEETPGTVKVLARRSELLSDPSEESRPTATVDEGTAVKILTVHESGEWYWVRAYNREGWISATTLDQDPLPRSPHPDDQDGHFLAWLKRYWVFENELYYGTSTMRVKSTRGLLQDYWAYTWLGVGYGKRLWMLDNESLVTGEGTVRVLRDSLQGVGMHSLQVGGKLRWMEPEDQDYFFGAGLGLGLHLSGWPSGTSPLDSSPHAIRWSMGPAIGGRVGPERLIWVLEPLFELGKYSGFALNLRVLWPK